MTRWLTTSREGLGVLTKPTEPTKPAPKSACPEVLSVLSVLSGWLRSDHGVGNEDLRDLLDAWEERSASTMAAKCAKRPSGRRRGT